MRNLPFSEPRGERVRTATGALRFYRLANANGAAVGDGNEGLEAPRKLCLHVMLPVHSITEKNKTLF